MRAGTRLCAYVEDPAQDVYKRQVREQLKTTWKLTCTDADIEIVDSDKPAGEILWQSIESGTEVTEGDTIKFKVSSGLAPSQSRTISVMLPQDGRESVDVWVTVDGEEQYNKHVSCAQGSISVSLTGSGIQHVQEMCIRDRLVSSGVQIPQQGQLLFPAY